MHSMPTYLKFSDTFKAIKYSIALYVQDLFQHLEITHVEGHFTLFFYILQRIRFRVLSAVSDIRLYVTAKEEREGTTDMVSISVDMRMNLWLGVSIL